MKISFLQRFIGPLGIILTCSVIVFLWFGKGLLFAGAEDELSFYNYTKSLNLFSQVWYSVGTGYSTLSFLPRFPYFLIFEPLYRLGVSNILLEAVTFLLLILTGTLSVFFLGKETISRDLKKEWKTLVPFLASIFYFLNPFSMTQIWGRALSYQFFSFALVPSFLLFFVLSIQRKNLFFCISAALIIFFLSTAYVSPAVVITSWSGLGIYLFYYIFINRKNYQNIYFALSSFILLLISWTLINFFWIYPTIRYGGEMLNANLTAHDNIASLKGLAPHSHLLNVIRLIHREYYDGTYGGFSGNFFISLLSWFLPLIFLFSVATFKKVKHFGFYLALFLISIFVTIGANFPTGWLLIWLFEKIPFLQVLRNPYEKFGVNLVLACAPFFAIGLLVFSEKFALLFKKPRLKNIFVPLFLILTCVVLVWPIWKGNFAGGVQFNNWVKVPDYYKRTNDWFNSQPGNFNILHLPLLPEDGITHTWQYPFEGIEPSEFLFDKGSIARNFGFNKDYHSALLERFGATVDYKKLPNFSSNNLDFKDISLIKESVKLNVRYIVLHYDTNYKFRRTTSPEETKAYLENQQGIKKVKEFGKLEIYKVDIPANIDLIYSPNLKIDYQKINTSNYLVNIENAREEIDLYFLQQFHPSWQAFVNGERIENHSKVFSYANKWVIKKRGNYQVEIKFVQQDSVNFGTKVAFLSVEGLVLILFLYYLFKVRKLLF